MSSLRPSDDSATSGEFHMSSPSRLISGVTCRVAKLKKRTIWCGLWSFENEIDPLPHNAPGAVDTVKALQLRDRLLRSAISGHTPERAPCTFRVINQLAVGRSEGLKRPAVRKLGGGAAACWNPPDLIAAGTVGFEINPLAIRRPGGHEIPERPAGQAPRSAALRTDHIDIGIGQRDGIERDPAPVR